MAEYLSKENFVFSMSGEHKPALKVKSGTEVVLETYDCFCDQIKSEEVNFDGIDWEKINPATGPVYIENAMPGDILKVQIKKIELEDEGTVMTGPELTPMGDKIPEYALKKVPIQNGTIQFNENIRIPVNPMIGVIGVAPKEGSINNGTPHDHGGNMDTKLITEGATVYFPVFHEGALFSLGDVHAAMGDGEVGASGVEIASKVTVRLCVIKGASIPTPVVENDDGFAFIVSRETLDEAADTATQYMADYLVEKAGISLSEAMMLLSLTG